MRKHLLSLALTLLTLALPVSAFADTTNAPAKPGGLPPVLNDFLRTADTFILFSIEPVPGGQAASTNTFSGRTVVGQLTIKHPETRTTLIEALDKGVRAILPPPSRLQTGRWCILVQQMLNRKKETCKDCETQSALEFRHHIITILKEISAKGLFCARFHQGGKFDGISACL